jgi:hypothetical protein
MTEPVADVGDWVASASVVDWRGEPARGIVCAVVTRTTYDDETGERADAVSYRVRDPDDGDRFRNRVIPDGDAVVGLAATPRDVGRLARRLAKEIGALERGGKIPALTYSEVMAWHDVTGLLRVVG